MQTIVSGGKKKSTSTSFVLREGFQSVFEAGKRERKKKRANDQNPRSLMREGPNVNSFMHLSVRH